jgi:hypothetical protein
LNLLRFACSTAAVALATIVGCKGSQSSAGGGGSSITTGTGGLACVTVAPPAGYDVCHTDDECAQDQWCVEEPPSDSPTCDPDEVAANGCWVDTDCAWNEVCDLYGPSDPCAYAVGPTQEYTKHCVPACNGTPCDAGSSCGGDGRCQPDPCTGSYQCPADSSCAPTSSAQDEHGCAPPRCEDGFACPLDLVCRPTAHADRHGCAPLPCYDGWTCPEGTKCVVGSSFADGHDCAPLDCVDGYVCPPNSRCDPEAEAYPNRCVPIPCDVDADCDCGFCIDGWCKLSLSVCVDADY